MYLYLYTVGRFMPIKFRISYILFYLLAECHIKANPSSPDTKQNCSGSAPYCMTNLRNYVNGYRETTKRYNQNLYLYI